MQQIIVVLVLLVALSIGAPIIKINNGNQIDGSWIVVFKNNITDDLYASHKALVLSMDSSNTVDHEYFTVYRGFAGKLSDDAVKYLSSVDTVDFIEQDQIMSISQTCQTQTGATWGLARVSTKGAPVVNTNYKYNLEGTGVTSYVIDTGVRITHNQFGGRASYGYSAFGDTPSDGNGHGTHVAGTIGGSTYGIAKRVNIVAVKVLNAQGSGTNAGVINGVDWVGRNCGTKLCTANMSLGGGVSSALDTACNNIVTSNGVTLVVAAGNDNRDACNYSPARTGGNGKPVISVGSLNQWASGRNVDTLSSFSNFGSCVDVYAPGSSITSAWHTSDSATNTISGTSMASPHVCGVASLLRASIPTPASIKNRINSDSSATISPAPTNNRVLYAGC
eukprot:TRINITY_DN459_c0_g1_i5.p1 TRINITY_DN459_c0_g1~~TRINITY_DN459_c0_g1_i5.p1  ORF type:complete len:391 (+),score=98.32 TRINITY_DN459_c0_g1_i5:97-1269(+)